MGESYYEVLEIDPDATSDEIQSAYRARVLETHPDRNDDPDAAEQFQRVVTAEEVLGDETERARYDRLGHDAYRSMAEGPFAANTESSPDGEGEATSSAGPHGRSTRAGARANGGRSHHARHRAERQRAQRRHRQRAKRRTRHWSGRDSGDGSRTESATTAGSAAGNRTRRGGSATASTAGDGEGTFRYAVHDWEGDVDLEPVGRPLDRHTLVGVGCVTLLYPILVYSSLTPQFPIAVNATVAACTVIIVGYLLTMPRVAIASFGLWSALVTVALVGTDVVDPVSILGILALAACWVPFGFGLGAWWALRP